MPQEQPTSPCTRVMTNWPRKHSPWYPEVHWHGKRLPIEQTCVHLLRQSGFAPKLPPPPPCAAQTPRICRKTFPQLPRRAGAQGPLQLPPHKPGRCEEQGQPRRGTPTPRSSAPNRPLKQALLTHRQRRQRAQPAPAHAHKR